LEVFFNTNPDWFEPYCVLCHKTWVSVFIVLLVAASVIFVALFNISYENLALLASMILTWKTWMFNGASIYISYILYTREWHRGTAESDTTDTAVLSR